MIPIWVWICVNWFSVFVAASTKRSHDWIAGGGVEQMNHRQASSSSVRGGIVMSKQSGAGVRDAAPLSPPSSSIKNKIVSDDSFVMFDLFSSFFGC